MQLEINDEYFARRHGGPGSDDPNDNETALLGILHVRPGERVVLPPDGGEAGSSRPEKPPELEYAARGSQDADPTTATAKVARVLATATRQHATGRTALLTSGGLDSAVLAGALGSAREDDELHGLTAVPHPDCPRHQEGAIVTDEYPRARELEAELRNLRIERIRTSGNGLLASIRSATLATMMPLPTPVNLGWYAEAARRTRELGCSTLLESGYGNVSVTYTGADHVVGEWLAGEHLGSAMAVAGLAGRGEWLGCASITARIARTLGVTMERSARRTARGERSPDTWLGAELLARVRGRRREAAFEIETVHPGCRDRLTGAYARDEPEARLFRRMLERRHAIRMRDPMADHGVRRACLEVPRHGWLRGGRHRLVGRALASRWVGPQIAGNRVRGLQGADRHYRLTNDLEELRDLMASWRRDPEIAGRLDIERAARCIAAWPERLPWSRRDHQDAYWFRTKLPRVILSAIWIGLVTNFRTTDTCETYGRQVG